MQENPLFFCTYRISLYYFKALHKYFLHLILLFPPSHITLAISLSERHWERRMAFVPSLEGELWATQQRVRI